jgi:Tfp pilus assembly protein PilF
LERIGDRAAALQLYQEFHQRLTREYGADPAPATLALGASLREPGAWAIGVQDHRPATPGPPAVTPFPTAPASAPATAVRHSGKRPLLLIAAVAVALVSAFAFWPGSPSAATALDQNRLVVLPLRIVGSDSALGFLREGMIDLLSPKLAGASGPQMADPAVVLQRWRRAGGRPDHDLSEAEALRLARELRGGSLLLTTLVESPRRIDLQATLYRVADGHAEKPVVVTGPRDSLFNLVDRFAAALLLRSAGEDEARLADLTTRSLPALHAYLDAQRSFRAGAYSAAGAEFEEALRLDSSFALAGLAMAAGSSYWGDRQSGAGSGLETAWRWQSRLPPRDREFLRFVAEPAYPSASTLHQKIDNWEQATVRFPDRAVTWFQLGDNLFHWGLQIGLDDAEQRAASAFDRAIALDSDFTPALEHRIWLAAEAGDTAVLRRLGARYATTGQTAERLQAHQWRIAAALGDSATLRSFRSRFAELPTLTLISIHHVSQEGFPSPRDAEAAIALLLRRASRADEQYEMLMREHDLALNLGQPRRATQIIARSKIVEDPNWTDSEGRILVYDALYWSGDTAAAAAAAREQSARTSLPLPAEPYARARRYFDLCAAAQWRLSRGDLGYARNAATRLEQTHPPQDQPGDVAEHSVCAAIIRLGVALADSTDLERPAAHLDSLLASSLWVYALVRQAAGFVLAESWERRGDISRALVTVRRRAPGLWNRMVSTRLREEGRLAAAAGDSTAAIRAYRHYLALRPDPEAALVAEVNLVRGELQRLEEGAQPHRIVAGAN